MNNKYVLRPSPVQAAQLGAETFSQAQEVLSLAGYDLRVADGNPDAYEIFDHVNPDFVSHVRDAGDWVIYDAKGIQFVNNDLFNKRYIKDD